MTSNEQPCRRRVLTSFASCCVFWFVGIGNVMAEKILARTGERASGESRTTTNIAETQERSSDMTRGDLDWWSRHSFISWAPRALRGCNASLVVILAKVASRSGGRASSWAGSIRSTETTSRSHWDRYDRTSNGDV